MEHGAAAAINKFHFSAFLPCFCSRPSRKHRSSAAHLTHSPALMFSIRRVSVKRSVCGVILGFQGNSDRKWTGKTLERKAEEEKSSSVLTSPFSLLYSRYM